MKGVIVKTRVLTMEHNIHSLRSVTDKKGKKRA